MNPPNVSIRDVQAVYDGPEGELWELIMGEQIHVGGWKSSMELARLAGISNGMHGLDLCSALGAGCRFLAKNFGVTMTGLDATETMLRKARERAANEKLNDKISFVAGDVSTGHFPDGSFDFVWGEDAWCYVLDKEALIKHAALALKSGGVIAFTDWVEGPAGMTEAEAARIEAFMKFPNLQTRQGYESLLKQHGLIVTHSTDLTEEFAGYVDFYIKMLTDQLTYDALRIIGDDLNLFQMMGGEMSFMGEMAHAGKMGRCRIIARK